jgi:hypothetical protein
MLDSNKPLKLLESPQPLNQRAVGSNPTAPTMPNFEFATLHLRLA